MIIPSFAYHLEWITCRLFQLLNLSISFISKRKKSGITGPRLAQSPSISALVLVVFSQFFDTFRILSTKFDRRKQLKSHFCDHIIMKRFREILASCQRHWTLLTWHTTLVLMPATRLACHWRVLCLLFLRRATVIRHYTSLSYHSHVSTDWH